MNKSKTLTRYGSLVDRIKLIQPGTRWLARFSSTKTPVVTVDRVVRADDPNDWTLRMVGVAKPFRVSTLLERYHREDERPVTSTTTPEPHAPQVPPSTDEDVVKALSALATNQTRLLAQVVEIRNNVAHLVNVVDVLHQKVHRVMETGQQHGQSLREIKDVFAGLDRATAGHIADVRKLVESLS